MMTNLVKMTNKIKFNQFYPDVKNDKKIYFDNKQNKFLKRNIRKKQMKYKN